MLAAFRLGAGMEHLDALDLRRSSSPSITEPFA